MSTEYKRTPGGAILMDGNNLRDETVARLRKEIEAAGSPAVCLATVLVGGDKPSHIYVASKHKKAQEAGMISVGVHLEDDATQEQVEAEVRKLVADPSVHGILVQLPLPKHLDAEPVLALLPPEKDVDGLTERSMGRLLRGLPGHAPCTPLGVMRLLERYEIPTKGKRVVVIGRSTLTGLPQLLLFLRKGGDATTTCTHSHTSPEDLKAYCREADIIVSCVGIARLITADHVKPGATVIDVGVSREEAKIVGDVDFDSVQAVAGAITPMPGGTGPMTIGCLLENTLSAAKMLGAFSN
ncbi:MAG: bifunctional 5,10-methylenetetrahydrofolate dehydrogenase/5,10-methenyltetrahydrofolate cyclohydrolase [Actinomycetota bacterium]|nr:bifunctional 5,10-methylenetetrahydrofolate dehydrogenase/5,10-methenyltetrahydrofolate cyclohydrolase [Actinomycetota bacterium]